MTGGATLGGSGSGELTTSGTSGAQTGSEELTPLMSISSRIMSRGEALKEVGTECRLSVKWITPLLSVHWKSWAPKGEWKKRMESISRNRLSFLLPITRLDGWKRNLFIFGLYGLYPGYQSVGKGQDRPVLIYPLLLLPHQGAGVSYFHDSRRLPQRLSGLFHGHSEYGLPLDYGLLYMLGPGLGAYPCRALAFPLGLFCRPHLLAPIRVHREESQIELFQEGIDIDIAFHPGGKANLIVIGGSLRGSFDHFGDLERFLRLREKRSGGRGWGGEEKGSSAVVGNGPVRFPNIFSEGLQLFFAKSRGGESSGKAKKGGKEKK